MSAAVAAVRRRLMLLVGRAVIAAVQSSGGRVTLDLTPMLSDEEGKAVELAEPWGFTSIPLEGAEVVTLSVMGERSNMVAISLGDRRHRPKDGVPGESIAYDEQGQRIAIKRDRIEIISPKPVFVKSPTIAMEADSATINGNAIATVGDFVQVQGGSSAGRHPIVTGVGEDG